MTWTWELICGSEMSCKILGIAFCAFNLERERTAFFLTCVSGSSRAVMRALTESG